MRSNPRTLVYSGTGKPVHRGDIVPDFRGDLVEVLDIIEPRHEGSTGRVSLREIKSEFTHEYYPGVIDAEWIDRFTIIHFGPDSIHPEPSIN